MAEQKTVIVAENVCDLPQSVCKQYGIEIVYFLVETDTGIFTDADEITTENLLEYMENGGKKSYSQAPAPESYKKTFEKCLNDYDEVILISISDKISQTIDSVKIALEQLGDKAERVHIFDSESLSTGIGHMVIRAAKMAQEGASADEILEMLQKLKKRVVTTFIVDKTDYMVHKELISPKLNMLCTRLSLHPVIVMIDGKASVKSIKIGRYDKAYKKYIKSLLKKNSKIDRALAFITHVGCSQEMIENIKAEVNKLSSFDRIEVTDASAAISSNCGQGTFGVLFVKALGN